MPAPNNHTLVLSETDVELLTNVLLREKTNLSAIAEALKAIDGILEKLPHSEAPQNRPLQ